MIKAFPILLIILFYTTTYAQQSNPNAAKIAALEKEKDEAVIKQDFPLASKLKIQIEELKNPIANPNAAKIAVLEKEKDAAVAKQDFPLASKLKKEIEALKNPIANPNAAKISALETQKDAAVAKQDFPLASKLKKQIEELKNPALVQKVNVKNGSNLRETVELNMSKQDFATSNTTAVITANANNEKSEKIKHDEGNEIAKNLKYRRSSLYTLMINDNARLHSNVIKDAFGNSTMPQKFNNHNIGPYLIDTKAELKDQTAVINSYISTNNIAKSIVAKWFNRSNSGKFNMDLIAARGMYDATAMDKVISNSLERGDAMLKDAGEELIGNTFVIVNDYKFTNKEELAKKGKIGMKIIQVAANYAGAGDVTNLALKGVEAGITIAGKGYIIKSTSYLYRLVWDEETEAIFYNNYWVDENNFDPVKVAAFNNANNFKLQFIGSQDAYADVQSSIFTDKSDEDLIRMATVKATDKAIAKLEKKYEAFRTKTPLYSGYPITAKIGLKEDLKGGDKFEVLEQVLDMETGKTIYKRVGIIEVDGDNIWDNSLSEEETEQLRIEGKLPEQQYTYFKGSDKFYAGQLIKQIN